MEVTYLKCVLDEMTSGESIALKVINNINSKLKFLYKKNRFLSQNFEGSSAMQLLSHILIMHIQPSTLISLKKNEKENTSYTKQTHKILLKTGQNVHI